MDKRERARRARLAEMKKKQQKQQRRRGFVFTLLLIVIFVFVGYQAGIWKTEEEAIKTSAEGWGRVQIGYNEKQNWISVEESAKAVDEETLQILEAGLTAESALLMKRDEVIYAKNAEQRLYPASMTKLMTALVALKYGSPEDAVTVPDLSSASCYIEDSVLAFLQEGDQLTLKDLIGIMLVSSANDAASAIACYIGGSEEGYAEMMNQFAIESGAMNTHFTNPHGLHDEEHYTCANDMMLFLKAAVNNELLLNILQSEVYDCSLTRDDTIQELSFSTTSKYLNGQYSIENFNYVAGKTGYTGPAGRCFASCFEKDHEYYYCIVMKSEDYVTATSLLYYYASEPAQMKVVLEQQKGG